MTRILLADDHTLVREGLKQILSATTDLVVAGEAIDGDQALARVREGAYDVVMVDMSMPGLSGIDLIKRLKLEKPKVKILVLSMHGEEQYAVRAYKAGASGYLTKDSASRQLVEAIRKVAAGGAFISSEVAEQLALGAMPGAQSMPHEALSDREFQVFRMIAEGKSVSDIAERLNLSVKTVSTHKANIMQKMQMGTAGDLIRYALSHGLVEGSAR